MTKGITPVIAIILLLLITISIIGFTAAFFQSAVKTSGEQAEQATQSQISTGGQLVEPVASGSGTVTIKSVGSSPVTQVAALVNGTPVAATLTSPIAPGGVGTLSFNQMELASLPAGKIKIVAAGNEIDADNPVALSNYWQFDDATLRGVAKDSAGGSDGAFYGEAWNDGTLVNGPVQGAGKYGDGLQFDGTNDYVDAGNVLNFGTGDFTLSAWFKISGSGMIVNKKNDCGAAPAGYGIGVSGGGILVLLADGSGCGTGNYLNEGGDGIVRGSGFADNQWHHVAVAFDRIASKTAKVYVDGVQQGSNINLAGVTGSASTGESFRIGVRKSWFYFPGTLDEVRTYGKVLTPQEVGDDMNSMHPVTSAAASYNFESVTGNIALDSHNVVKGKYGTAFSFDGTNDYVDTGAGSASITGDLTVSGWIYWSGPSGANAEPISTHYGKNDFTRPYSIFMGGGAGQRVDFRVGNGVAQFTAAGPEISLNAWHHVAGTISGTTISIYVDGVLGGTATFSGARQTGTKLTIGGDGAGSRPFNGMIDEVKIINRAIS